MTRSRVPEITVRVASIGPPTWDARWARKLSGSAVFTASGRRKVEKAVSSGETIPMVATTSQVPMEAVRAMGGRMAPEICAPDSSPL
jgi:hypothetical protein